MRDGVLLVFAVTDPDVTISSEGKVVLDGFEGAVGVDGADVPVGFVDPDVPDGLDSADDVAMQLLFLTVCLCKSTIDIPLNPENDDAIVKILLVTKRFHFLSTGRDLVLLTNARGSTTGIIKFDFIMIFVCLRFSSISTFKALLFRERVRIGKVTQNF